MPTFIIKIYFRWLKCIYFFMKMLRSQRKITMISRESDSIPPDFRLVADAIRRRDSDCKVVILPKMLHKNWRSAVHYAFHMYRQMYHLATSRAVLLDTYCIPVSILTHKKSLTVVQMWHAMGALKKFGYSVLDRPGGSTRQMARLMNMHRHYDFVLVSSPACVPYFCEAFDISPKKIVVLPLPRTDLLRDQSFMERKREEIYRAYPILKKKKNIVWFPTFRKKRHIDLTGLIKQIDFSRYNLVVSPHPLMHVSSHHPGVIVPRRFSSLELLSISDFIINDYSAFIFEAAMTNKPMFFYTPDLQNYVTERDFYIDYRKEMPGPISDSAAAIVKAIESGRCDTSRNRTFCAKYIAAAAGDSATEQIVSLLLHHLDA